MFAEELSGNASRKRQEDARERRRQAKLAKEKKNQKTTSSMGLPSATKSTEVELMNPSAPSPSIVGASVAEGVGLKKSVLTGQSSSAKETSNLSSVVKALEERKLRSVQKIQQKSSMIIQSYYRSHRSNTKLLQTEKDKLEKRLNDLIKLGVILQNKQNHPSSLEYAPPPSLAIGMLNQLLFITHTIPRFHKMRNDNRFGYSSEKCDNDQKPQVVYHSKIRTTLTNSDAILISRIVKHVLLSGVLSPNVNMDPMVVFLESSDGVIKLRKLLRLCCFILIAKRSHGSGTSPFVLEHEQEINVLIYFFRILLGSDVHNSLRARGNIVFHCKGLLLSQNMNYDTLVPGGVKLGQSAIHLEQLDLIRLLRSFLLYPSSKGDDCSIIPSTANELREKSINPGDKVRGDIIFNFVLDMVLDSGDNHEKYESRFFAEIFTCPLLLWKIESKTVHKFVQCSNKVEHSAPLATEYFPFMLRCLASFIRQFEMEISQGLIGSSLVLPSNDMPLKLCPAPTALCLLANMTQFGMVCPSINGSDMTKLDFVLAAMYFNTLAAIIDVVPLGTYSSRLSSVEWVTSGSHLTPIVLSKVIQDHCKLLLVESYVRTIFNCAIDEQALNSTFVINHKSKKDLEQEEELNKIGETSAKALAAKEAMVDRSKKFWQSNWAMKLSKKVTSIFSGKKQAIESQLASSTKGKRELLDTSSTSRRLAEGVVNPASIPSNQKETQLNSNQPYAPSLFLALCRAYSVILSRWGGGGKDDMVKRSITKNDFESQYATSTADPFVLSLLNVLTFSTSTLTTSWVLIQSEMTVVSDLNLLLDANKRPHPIRSLSLRTSFKKKYLEVDKDKIGAVVLLMFTTILVHTLIVTDDMELHEMGAPLPQHQIRRCILLLKKLLHRVCCVDDTVSSNKSYPSNHLGLSLIASSSKAMRDLYDRSSRRPLCAPKHFLISDLMKADIRQCNSYDDYASLLKLPVLRICPFLVSFKVRLKLFERIVTTNRISIQGRNDGFHPRPGVSVNIMRGRVLEDGLIHLNKLGPNLRQRLIVNYLNQAGAKEAGIDAGGLFKEFWTDLSILSFDPNYALFYVTEGSSNYLYPNPSAQSAHGSDSIVMFEFLGRILGKALYEGITIQPQFAHFFLSFLRGDYNSLHMLPYLCSMDPTLYNNLMFLKTYDGDASDLCLSFTVTTDDFGINKEISLMPNGANIDVTNRNKHHYIGLVAKYYVYDRVAEQSQAFTRGLRDVIDKEWLRIFNEPELQVLISGPSDGKIDVLDMKTNTRYSGGYTSFDRNVNRFWNVVSSFNDKQQADLLRFVTSCERPPPLGFSCMNPPFTIQRVGILKDGDKLPSASTCFNILKLPTYSSQNILRDRLLYAIKSGAGFELT